MPIKRLEPKVSSQMEPLWRRFKQAVKASEVLGKPYNGSKMPPAKAINKQISSSNERNRSIVCQRSEIRSSHIQHKGKKAAKAYAMGEKMESKRRK
jgi:hypothetical protein